MRSVLLCLVLLGSVANAYQITSLKVGGGEAAEVQLQASDAPASLPTPVVKGTQVELFFAGAQLHDSFHGNLSLHAPHALIRELQATSDKKGVLLRIDVNGNAAALKDRLNLSRGAQGFQFTVGSPSKPSAAVALAKEEQLPVLSPETLVKPAAPLFGLRQIFLILFVFAAAGAATFFVVKFLKVRGKAGGNQKYLIEQLAHCSLGAKTGVSLVRVGRQFVLVGVTPTQVNLISSLPALQAQYEQETEFERDSFKDAVDDEIERLKKEIAI